MKNKNADSGPGNLRRKAESLLTPDSRKQGTPQFSEADALKLIHELQVHQVELELQKEELLQAKEMADIVANEFADLYDFAPSGYFTLNSESKIAQLNLSGSQLLGKERSLIINSYFSFYVSLESRSDFNLFLKRVFNSMKKEKCDVVLITKNKEPVYVHLTGIVFGNKDECLINGTDVTTLRQAEQKLMVANKELAFENLEKAKRAAELVIANKELAFENEEKANRAAELVIANKELAFENEEKANRAAELVIANQELAFENEEKANRAAELVVANQELVVQNEMEAKLVADLALSNAEKDKFFSVIAHDLRGPFSSFLGLTTLMNENLTGMTLDEIQVMVELMKKSATNLNNLLANMLEWSRMQRGLTPFSPATIMLGTEIAEIIEQVQETAHKKNITISIDIPADLMVFADLNMFMSTVRNLYGNAVKFTPGGGRVMVTAKAVSGDWVEISIKDNGIGMSKTLLEDLFRFDGNSSRKGTDDEPSTGLGLIICKDFIEKHGGILSVESQEGQGSIFRFTLPASVEMNEKTINPVEQPPKKNRKLKILIAEDDETSEMLMTIALKPYSREILKAPNGAEAVEICRNNPDIDLVLMDIKMPGLNGYEATREIRRFNADVVIIGQSAYGDIVDQEVAMELGWNDYLPKPFDPVMLRELVQKYF